jgi:hypothetical protein
MTAATAVAAAQGRARRLIVNGLREQGAVSAASAAAIPQPHRLRRVALGRLLRQGVVVEAGPDRYWLDEARWAQAEIERRKRITWALTVVAAAALIAALVAFVFARAH